jgi:hypothetical protein
MDADKQETLRYFGIFYHEAREEHEDDLNPKHEIRNTKQIQKKQIRMTKTQQFIRL